MVKKKSVPAIIAEICAVLLTVFTHLLLFYFVIVNAGKTNKEAARLSLALPEDWQFLENFKYVLEYRHNAIVNAFINSLQVTVLTITLVIIVSSMAAFILQRRRNNFLCRISHRLLVACLTVPAAVVPTYYMLKILHVDNTLPGLVLVLTAQLFPFCTMMYRSFIATIPRDIDEAAVLDGCNSFNLFWRVIFPMLKPTTASIIVLRSIVVFNDFQNAQYYLSGSKSQMIQVCVYTFKSAFGTKWAYLFTASILASIPMMILYLCFRKTFLKGTTEGAVKG